MTNDRLRSLISSRDLSGRELAERVGVDPKSVERWITQDRIPHPSTRVRVAEALSVDESYVWPSLLGRQNVVDASRAELVQWWPTRSTVPGEVWRSLLSQAGDEVDVLAYAAMFLVEAHGLVEHVRRVSGSGGSVRLLLGDPDAPVVSQRGVEEGLPGLPDRCRSAQEYLAETCRLPGVQLRLHATPLYSSIYRFGESMLVNQHTYGLPAKDSPTQHLRRVPSGMLFDHYRAAFERVWSLGRPVP